MPHEQRLPDYARVNRYVRDELVNLIIDAAEQYDDPGRPLATKIDSIIAELRSFLLD
jgi:hypothetical protein